MLKLNINRTRKELSLIVLVVAIISLVVWLQWGWWSGAAPQSIAEYTVNVPHGVDMDQPVSAKNPIDGTHTELLTIFAANPGKVKISQYPHLPGQSNVEFEPRLVARRGGRFDAYQQALKQSGGARQMTAWACYAIADGQNWAFAIRSADATAEQNRALRSLATDLRDNLRSLAATKSDGSFKARDLNQLHAMLDAYNKLPGDSPAKDPNSPKAAMAWKIFQAGRAYATAYDEARDALILATADKMLKVFNSEQQSKLAAAAQGYASQAQRRAGG